MGVLWLLSFFHSVFQHRLESQAPLGSAQGPSASAKAPLKASSRTLGAARHILGALRLFCERPSKSWPPALSFAMFPGAQWSKNYKQPRGFRGMRQTHVHVHIYIHIYIYICVKVCTYSCLLLGVHMCQCMTYRITCIALT
jgi:hypothetical protein